MPSARHILFALFAFLAAEIAAKADVVIDRGSEIVLPNNAAYATRLAAEELNFFLKGVLGEALPVVAQRTEGKTAIVLGAGGGSPGRLAPPCGHAGRVPLPISLSCCAISHVTSVRLPGPR